MVDVITILGGQGVLLGLFIWLIKHTIKSQS